MNFYDYISGACFRSNYIEKTINVRIDNKCWAARDIFIVN